MTGFQIERRPFARGPVERLVMYLHDKHMALIDAVNNAETPNEKRDAEHVLRGWRDGLSDAGVNIGQMLIDADLRQMARGHDCDMCCGVFL